MDKVQDEVLEVIESSDEDKTQNEIDVEKVTEQVIEIEATEPVKDVVKEEPLVRDYTNYNIEEFKENLVQLDTVYTNTADIEVAFNLTVIGRRHVVEETVCQDNSGVSFFTSKDDLSMFAVSDGHGSVAFSQDGSRIAITCLTEIMNDMVKQYTNREVVELIKSLYFKERLISKWKDSVIKDALEQKRISKEDIQNKTDEDLVASYGCTLLFVMQIDDSIICGNIGDGEIVLLSKNNELYKHINEEDSLDESTLSMSHLRPDFMVVEVFDVKDFDYALVCTDGISKPFGYMFDGILENVVSHLNDQSVGALRDSFMSLIHGDYRMLSDDMSVSFGVFHKEKL